MFKVQYQKLFAIMISRDSYTFFADKMYIFHFALSLTSLLNFGCVSERYRGSIFLMVFSNLRRGLTNKKNIKI